MFHHISKAQCNKIQAFYFSMLHKERNSSLTDTEESVVEPNLIFLIEEVTVCRNVPRNEVTDPLVKISQGSLNISLEHYLLRRFIDTVTVSFVFCEFNQLIWPERLLDSLVWLAVNLIGDHEEPYWSISNNFKA